LKNLGKINDWVIRYVVGKERIKDWIGSIRSQYDDRTRISLVGTQEFC